MAKKIEAPGVVLPRLKLHRTALNRILLNDNLSGSRRLVAAMLAMWIDAYDHPERQDRLLAAIEGLCGSPQRLRFVADDEPALAEVQDKEAKDATQKIKAIFEQALSEEK